MKPSPSSQQQILTHLTANEETLSTAESCTGGLIAATLTALAGASQAYVGGVIVYSNESKKKLLHITEEALEKFGPVSEEIAKRMAINCRKQLKTTWSLSIVGFLGPTGGTKKAPLGTVIIALASDQETIIKKVAVSGSRAMAQKKAATLALSLLAEKLCLE